MRTNINDESNKGVKNTTSQKSEKSVAPIENDDGIMSESIPLCR